MNWIVFLILFPLLPAALLLITRSTVIQKWIVLFSSALIGAGVIGLAMACAPGYCQYFRVESTLMSGMLTAGDVLLAVAFLLACRGLSLKRYYIPLLVLVQYGLVTWYHLSGWIPESERYLYVDNLSVIMALIIGIIGPLIAIYTVGYMERYHKDHPEVPDRRGRFMAAMFLFFFGMYGIIFSNTIPWIYFFWEVTTLCSFVMIRYSLGAEAVENAFRALWMLLIGGMAFAASIVFASNRLGTVELSSIVEMKEGAYMLPVLLLVFAGMNKAAQFPFARWLLGAMVAPTPCSALLHSSTMVKAGVYLLLRCSPALADTAGGSVVAFTGGLSFLAGSALAISQRDAKRVLAYSTIANLGLITLCAGVGTYGALWAAVLLIIFHAVAKALMFLCVGTVEQQVGTRDIEDMHGLISERPVLTIVMLIGMAGMFLAPFGMLISKWAVIQALAARNPVYPPIVIFGSSLHFFFWAKWMGKLTAVTGAKPSKGKTVGTEWPALYALAFLTILATALYPLVGVYLIEPLYGYDPMLSRGSVLTVIAMLGLMLLLPLGFFIHWKNLVRVAPYLSGANVDDPHQFMGSFGRPREWSFRNYYLDRYFSEGVLFRGTLVGSIGLLVLMFLVEHL
jgi:ech hydrogenase subunit A